eukprot:Skav235371  [mRNA]  locus=scaffold3967:237440:238268:- [translate_table: standard]
MKEFAIDGCILLIDLALSESHDVTNPQLLSQFQRWIKEGKIGALLMAPPCETWSQARFQPTDRESDPRPVSYGAKSVKPTHIAVAHVKRFKNYASFFEQPVQWETLEVLTGRRADNSWATAAAKEYPPRMNRFLSYCMIQGYRLVKDRCPTVYDPEDPFVVAVSQLYCGDVEMSQQEMQPDFGGYRDWDAVD